MKVLLLNPPGVGRTGFVREGRCEQRLSSFQYMMPPVSLLSIAALLRENGHTVAIIDAVAQPRNRAVLYDDVQAYSPEKVAVAQRLLTELGLRQPRIVGELQPYGLHHGVGPGDDAIRDCEACHSGSSRLTQPLRLAEYFPGGVVPEPVGNTDVVFAGAIDDRISPPIPYLAPASCPIRTLLYAGTVCFGRYWRKPPQLACLH